MKTYGNTSARKAVDNVPDIGFWGNGDMWRLIGKASSEKEKWMKSTKAMQMPNGCLVQVTTQQGDNIAEAITFVPNVQVVEVLDNDGECTSRYFEPLRIGS